MPAVDEYEGGAASAAGMIAMVETGTVQPSRGWRMAAGADKFPRSERKPSREAFIQSTGANAGQSGCGRSARTSPMLGTKPSTGGVGGEWRLTWTSFHVWDESPSEGRLFSSQGQMPAIGLETTYERQARTSFVFGTKPSREALVQLFAGSGRASVMAVVFTCNMYSVPYKGKRPQKTPFPKISEYTDTFICYIL